MRIAGVVLLVNMLGSMWWFSEVSFSFITKFSVVYRIGEAEMESIQITVFLCV